MDPLILDPAVEVAYDVRAFCANAEGREGLHLLEVLLLLIRVADPGVRDLDGVLELICVVLAPHHSAKVALANDLDQSELLLKPRLGLRSRLHGALDARDRPLRLKRLVAAFVPLKGSLERWLRGDRWRGLLHRGATIWLEGTDDPRLAQTVLYLGLQSLLIRQIRVEPLDSRQLARLLSLLGEELLLEEGLGWQVLELADLEAVLRRRPALLAVAVVQVAGSFGVEGAADHALIVHGGVGDGDGVHAEEVARVVHGSLRAAVALTILGHGALFEGNGHLARQVRPVDSPG